jgi:hypothetical protein
MKLRPLRAVLHDRDHGWGPLLWVLYLGFFFVQPVADHVSARQWALDGVGAAIFLVLYWGIFLLERPRPLVHVGGMILLGILYLPFNAGGCTFFIFAAAMVPFLVDTQRKAIAGLGIVAAIAATEGLSSSYKCLGAFLGGGISGIHRSRKRLFRGTEPHEPEASQGE